jgi:hypothetical protein
MTTREQERRNPSTERVKVATLVEVCGNIPGIPVFEAESINVSPQGMHLRTAYLPEAGAPLVCRFESDGREIVVEGMVAWRNESGRGGEFGVKFTALDSRSVDALRSLCGIDEAADGKGEHALGEPGARVRLHIEGLGSPMKARVKTGGSAKLQVGSSLEFLKVGKRLELEDLEVGGRRAAEIDTVSVVVDPSTRVPQLVVGLVFEGADEQSPSPSVASIGPGDPASPGVRIPTAHVSTDAAPRRSARASVPAESRSVEGKVRQDATAAVADEDDERDEEPEMRGRVAAMAANAEQRAKVAGEKLSRASATAAHGALVWMRGASERLLSRKPAVPARRTTSPAPSSMPAEKPRLRSQSGVSAPTEELKANPKRQRAIVIGASASLIAAGVLAFALRGPSAPPPGAKTEGVTDNAAQSVPAALGEAAPKATVNAPSIPGAPVVANVPLFGPTPLTTTEPAPLGPPPGADAANLEASERAEAKASIAPHSLDESFPESEDEGPSHARDKRGDKTSSSADAKPEDVSPWGHGKMHEPTIHRLRLDAAGAKIAGNMEPTGFTVVIPSRKAMETGAAISKRDPRIARVRVLNTPSGAQISFRFRDGVPSYRVRLRRDNVEFLISEPSKEAKTESKPTTSSGDSVKKKSAAN